MGFVCLNLVLQVFQRNLGVFNDQVNLELLDTETNWDPLVGTPGKTVHLDSLDVGQQFFQVGLVIPWLDVQGNDRLGFWLWTLSSLLGGVLSESLLLQLLSSLINFFVRGTEEVNVIVVFFFSSLGGWSVTDWERIELFGERVDVIQPSSELWVFLLEGLVDSDVSLGGGGANVSML